jgi:copper(I)-binding protein
MRLSVVTSAVFTVLRSNVVWSKASWRSSAGGLPRRLLIVAAVALIPAVAGCEAGDSAPTLAWHQPTVGTGTDIQGMAIRNVFVLGGQGNAALPAGGSAGLFLALVNTGSPDRLVSIEAPGTATAVTLAGGGIQLGTNSKALLTGPTPDAVLTGLTRRLRSGPVVTIVLNFQRRGAVTMRIPVVARTQYYATLSPPAPTPTAHPRKPGRSASAPASLTPTPSVSTTP